MLLSAEIYDQDHNILASIEDNKYDTDSAVFRVQRDDLSSLTVYARKDKEEVLSVRFLNPHMIAITEGSKTREEVVALPDVVIVNGQPYNMGGNCLSGDAKPSDAVIEFQ